MEGKINNLLLVAACSLGISFPTYAGGGPTSLKILLANAANSVYCSNHGVNCNGVTFITPLVPKKPLIAVCKAALILYYDLTNGRYPTCYTPSCGDGKIQPPGEICEPTLSTIPNGSCNATCQISCNSGYHLSSNTCVINCGDNVIQPPEVCDGTSTPDNSVCAASCASFTCNAGFENVAGACVVVAPKHAYIGNFGGAGGSDTVSLCNVEADGSFSACAYTPAATPSIFNDPVGITLNKAGTTAYVSNYRGFGPVSDNSVFKCSVNVSDGTFSSCVDSGNTGNPFIRPFMIALNDAETIAYVVNNEAYDDGNPTFDDPVLKCPINPDGTFGACANALATPGTGVLVGTRPTGITLNKAGTQAYVLNDRGSGSVFICPINPDGTFGDCIDSGQGATFSNPIGITLNKAETYAYITSVSTSTVRKCPINGDGTLGVCVDSGATLLSLPIDVKLNRAETFAYVTNWGNSTVTKCAVNAGDGSLSACVDSGGTGFNGAFGMTLGY